MLGTRQAGTVGLKIADLMRDAHLLPEVKQLAEGYAALPDQASKNYSSVGRRQARICQGVSALLTGLFWPVNCIKPTPRIDFGNYLRIKPIKYDFLTNNRL